MKFELASSFQPAGDQISAVRQLTERLNRRDKHCTLLGVTGSGKTFTMANVIRNLNRPTLVISHNKTLVAQLYSELKEFFPKNAVEYFVSYYDYYQPEAYVPQTDTFIEKDSSINEDIDRLRLRATSSLLSRSDSIVVASVSCIYGLGSPKEYERQLLKLKIGESVTRDDILRRLIDIRYERNDIDFSRGKFRVKGDVVDVFLAYDQRALRIRIDFDTVDALSLLDPTTGNELFDVDTFAVYPATHFVTTESTIEQAIPEIMKEMEEQKSL
ncbi:MAG: DEAD/DEAH box helicase family protein, partial [Candidatus Omnitrophica bacterium]|nr:DEAD/DEAH box helicase family protein [Candidatus Omnitrophota bacterium]